MWKIQRDDTVLAWTFFEGYRDSLAFAKAMHALNVTERKAVTIMGYNSPEWLIVFYGGIFFNCICTGVYNTNQADACLYQADHSESEVIAVDTIENLKKFLMNKDKLPNVKAYVVWLDKIIPADCKHPNVYLWQDFMQLGKSVPDSLIDQKIDKQAPGDCCTFVYTSGTTGHPKGVMLSHDNLCWSIESLFLE